MPIVATTEFILLDMAVLLSLVAPSKHHSLERREHGRTIPLNCVAVCRRACNQIERKTIPNYCKLFNEFCP
jgi:hypothetical protein